MEHYDRESNFYQEVSLPRRMFTIDGLKLNYLNFLMSSLVEYSVKSTDVTFYFIIQTLVWRFIFDIIKTFKEFKG